MVHSLLLNTIGFGGIKLLIPCQIHGGFYVMARQVSLEVDRKCRVKAVGAEKAKENSFDTTGQ